MARNNVKASVVGRGFGSNYVIVAADPRPIDHSTSLISKVTCS